MATQRDRREAAEILRRIVETLPDPTPVQVAFLLGQASGLDERVVRRVRAPEDSAARRRRNERRDLG
jgi:hypothetical protein